METVKFPDLYFTLIAPFKNLILFGATCHKLNFRMKVDSCIWIAADSNLVSTWEELQVYRFFMYLDIHVQQFFMYLYMYNRHVQYFFMFLYVQISSCIYKCTVVLYVPIHVEQFYIFLYMYSSSLCTYRLYVYSSSLCTYKCRAVLYIPRHVQQFSMSVCSSLCIYTCTVVHVPIQHSCTLYVQQEIYIFEKQFLFYF